MLDLGHSVTVLDNFSPQVHAGNPALAPDLRPNVKLITGDIADPAIVTSALEGAESVIHLAAETGTGQSMYEISRYVRTNLVGAALLYEFLTKLPFCEWRYPKR